MWLARKHPYMALVLSGAMPPEARVKYITYIEEAQNG